jgi:hypothetical protein
MHLLPGRVSSVVSAAKDGPATLEDAYNKYLQPLKIFNDFIGRLADLHPYANIALGLLSYACETILAQTDRDQAILRLLEKLGQVYEFMMQDNTLGGIPSMKSIVERIAKQTLECSKFIKDYSATKNYWRRLGKNIISETDSVRITYPLGPDQGFKTKRSDKVQTNHVIHRCEQASHSHPSYVVTSLVSYYHYLTVVDNQLALPLSLHDTQTSINLLSSLFS